MKRSEIQVYWNWQIRSKTLNLVSYCLLVILMVIYFAKLSFTQETEVWTVHLIFPPQFLCQSVIHSGI